MHSITAYEGNYWKSTVFEAEGRRIIDVEPIGYGMEFFKCDGTDDAQLREQAHALKEACALRRALDAGVCCEVWFEMRDRYGLLLPNWN